MIILIISIGLENVMKNEEKTDKKQKQIKIHCGIVIVQVNWKVNEWSRVRCLIEYHKLNVNGKKKEEFSYTIWMYASYVE